MKNEISNEEIRKILEGNSITELVSAMDEEQIDAFLKNVYNMVSENESFTGNGNEKFEVRFGSHIHHYTGYNIEKQEIYGYIDSTSFSGSGILAEDIEVDMGSDDIISFEEAENKLREKYGEKQESKHR